MNPKPYAFQTIQKYSFTSFGHAQEALPKPEYQARHESNVAGQARVAKSPNTSLHSMTARRTNVTPKHSKNGGQRRSDSDCSKLAIPFGLDSCCPQLLA